MLLPVHGETDKRGDKLSVRSCTGIGSFDPFGTQYTQRMNKSTDMDNQNKQNNICF